MPAACLIFKTKHVVGVNLRFAYHRCCSLFLSLDLPIDTRYFPLFRTRLNWVLERSEARISTRGQALPKTMTISGITDNPR